MLLCIDIGNTNITLGIFDQNSLGPRWRLATNLERMPDEFGIQLLGLLSHHKIKAGQIEHAAIASVVPPLTVRWVEVCRTYLKCKPLVIDSDIPMGIKLKVDKPSEVGADRIVDAVAAHVLFGGPACIIDFGTATTFDAISKEGDYLGGAISPGIGIARDALAEKTAKLPKIDLAPPPSPIGKNTVHAMQSGLLYGYVCMVEGMVVRFQSILGPEMSVIATGGLAELISEHTEIIKIVAPWLTLEGIKIIFDRNEIS
jgi:type III pantothenate kinase